LTVGNYFTEANGTGTALTAGDAITSTQTIYVYAANGTCTNENSFDVTITSTPTADSPSDVSVCDSYTLPALTVGNYFTGANGTGTALTAGDAITSTQTIYVYAANGTCTNENSFDVTITTTPTADSPSDVSVCDSYTLPALTVGNYFTEANGAGTALTAGDAITTSQTIYVYAANGTCTNENSFDVTITTTPTADAPSNVSVCDSYTLPALTVGNYFTGTNGTGTALSAGNSITSSQTIYVYETNGTCSDENSFDVTINTTPNFTSTLGAESCDAGTLTLEATPSAGTINWFAAASGGSSLFTGTSFTTPSISVTTTYYAEVANGSCVNATREAVDATILTTCTKIKASQCGATISSASTPVYADVVLGATGYRFELTDVNNTVTILDKSTPTYKFSDFNFLNNSTYSVRVSALVGGIYSNYGSACNVTLDARTSIQSSQCGSTVSSTATFVYGNSISGATAYRFELTDANNNVTVLNNSFRYFTFSQLNFLNNSTYSVRVAALKGGIYSNYGSACNVTLDVRTSIQTSQCGATVTSASTPIYGNSISGSTSYRFELTDVNNTVTVLDKPTPTFKFSEFNFLNNSTYSVRVAALKGGIYSNYGSACNVTLDVRTNIQTSQCGATVTSASTFVYANSISGATGYRFELTDINNNVTFLNNTNRYFTFSQLNFLNNSTYSVRVAALKGGIYSNYGSACNVTLDVRTKIQTSQCGATVTSASTSVFGNTISGATAYRFELTDQNNVVTVLDNPARSFKFSQFTYLNNSTYSVRVAALKGGVYSTYGDACNVTIATTGARPEEVVELKSMNEPTFDFEAFPNPSNGDFTISSSEVGTFNIINELGQLVRTVEITEANGNQVKVENMPNGAYFVTGTLNGEVVTKKVMVVR
jgi:hypothetical protein